MSTAVRLDALTGLRFVAALGVAFAHLYYLSAYGLFGRLCAEGGVGVPFFFVLSGFVLTHAYRDRLAGLERRALATYYVSRFARVWPLHLLTFALAAVFPINALPVTPGSAVANLFLVQAWSFDLHVIHGFNAVAWTLSIEAFFYLVMPFLLVGLLRWKSATPRQLTLAAALVVAVVYAWIRYQKRDYTDWSPFLVFHFPPARLGEFLVGMLLALAFRTLPTDRGRRIGWTVAEVGLLATLLAQMAFAEEVNPFYRHALYYLPTLAAIVAVFARSRGLLSKLFAGRTFVALGDVSFAFFLSHPFVFIFINNRFLAVMGPAVCAIVSLTLALVAAFALHHRVETPLRTAIPKWLAAVSVPRPPRLNLLRRGPRQPT